MKGNELIQFIQENKLEDYNFALVSGDKAANLEEDNFCIIDDGKDVFMISQTK